MKKENLLVVEDEAIMREALVDYFSNEGHRVDTADDGDKSLERFNLEDYDVIVIDLRLPGRDGLSVLKDVREKNPQAKVIMITAYPSFETKMEALRRGAIGYLQKPFDLDSLESLISQTQGVGVVRAPAVEEPTVEEEIITPCIWMQAGVVKKRTCPRSYDCLRGCDFHAAMMKKEKFRNDPRIQPYLEKLYSLLGKNQCVYTMSGDLSFRSCAKLYNCANCELDQAIQYRVSRKIYQKAKKRRERKETQAPRVVAQDKSARRDH